MNWIYRQFEASHQKEELFEQCLEEERTTKKAAIGLARVAIFLVMFIGVLWSIKSPLGKPQPEDKQDIVERVQSWLL